MHLYRATLATALFMLSASASNLAAQGNAPLPEYFGFYATSGNRIFAISPESKSNSPTEFATVTIVELGNALDASASAIKLGQQSHFILFDVAPPETMRSITLFRLPFLHREGPVTGGSRVRDYPALFRLPSNEVKLLQKPVPNQPQMIEVVPDAELAPGLYVVSFARQSSTGPVGVSGGSSNWTVVLSVGEYSMSVPPSSQCFNLVAMMPTRVNQGSRLVSAPLMDSRAVEPCSQFDVAAFGRLPGRAAPETVEQLQARLAANAKRDSATFSAASNGATSDFESSIDAGRAVSLPLRYNSATYGYIYLASGTLSISKSAIVSNGSVGTNNDFSVAPDKVILTEFRMDKGVRQLHLRVLVRNKKGDKEDKRDFYFYDSNITVSNQGPGGLGGLMSCSACNDALDSMLALIKRAQGK